MAVRPRKKIMQSLMKKGFRTNDSKHKILCYYTINGQKTTVTTHVSHSKKDIPEHLIKAMAKQCKLTKDEFLELVDCSMNQNEFERTLITKKHLSNPS